MERKTRQRGVRRRVHECRRVDKRPAHGFASLRLHDVYYDLTPHLKPGEKNVLAVRVDNTHFGNTRWYSGSGIYRHVWLNVTEPVHVAQWGTYVTTPEVSESKAQVVVQTVVRNDSDALQDCTLTTQILDSDGKTVATESSPLKLQQRATAQSRKPKRSAAQVMDAGNAHAL